MLCIKPTLGFNGKKLSVFYAMSTCTYFVFLNLIINFRFNTALKLALHVNLSDDLNYHYLLFICEHNEDSF